MAITITRPIVEQFDPNITDASGGFAVLSQALNNDPEANRAIVTNMNGGKPTFIVEASSNGNDIQTIGGSICTLAALGVTFPANSLRAVYTRVWSRLAGATAAGYFERLHMFLGNAALGSVTVPVEPATFALAINSGFAIPVTGTFVGTPNVVASHAFVDGTAGPFITVYQSTQAAFGTAEAVATAVRWRAEVYVGSLVVFPTF